MSDCCFEHLSFYLESTRIFSIFRWLNSYSGFTHFWKIFFFKSISNFYSHTKNIKNLHTYNFMFCFMWVWKPSPTLRKKLTFTLLANRALKKIFGPSVVSGTLIETAQRGASYYTVRMIKSRRMRCAYRILMGKSDGKAPRIRPRLRYVVGSKRFRADQLFKVTEIKQICYFST